MGAILIDTIFDDHPTFLEVDPRHLDAATSLWVRAAAYCSRHQTAGDVPRSALPALCRDREADAVARELVRVGLWNATPTGWSFREVLMGSGRPMLALARAHWSRDAYAEVYCRDGHACRYCGSGDDLTVDHVVPRCRGGSDRLENLVVACRSCNSRKGGRTPAQAGMALLPAPGGA